MNISQLDKIKDLKKYYKSIAEKEMPPTSTIMCITFGKFIIDTSTIVDEPPAEEVIFKPVGLVFDRNTKAPVINYYSINHFGDGVKMQESHQVKIIHDFSSNVSEMKLQHRSIFKF